MNPTTPTTHKCSKKITDQMKCAIHIDNRLRITHIQPTVQPFINLILADIGRCITHFTLNFLGYTHLELEKDIRSVLRSGALIERKLLNKNKSFYSLTIQLIKKSKLVQGASVIFKPLPAPSKSSTESLMVNKPYLSERPFVDVLLDSLPNYIFYLSREGRYLEYIQPPHSPCKLKAKSYIGKKVTDIYPPSMAAQVLYRIEVALKTGISQEFEYQAEWDSLRTFTCQMVKVDDGHVLCIAQDCTEQKIAEKAMLQSEYVYRKIATLFPDGLTIVFNCKKEIVLYEGQLSNYFINDPESIIGYQPCEIKNDYEDFWQYFTELYSEVIEGKSFHFEAPYRDFLLLFKLVPLRNEDNEIFGGLCLVQDITKTKAKQIQLQEQVEEITQKNRKLRQYIASNSELESFAYVTSHDLKQPLRNIVSFAQLLELRGKDDINKECKEYIQFIIDNARSMNYFIESLMNYSRISSTKNKIFEPINITESIQVIKQNLAQQLQENQVKILTQNLPYLIKGIKIKFIQLLQNLISNAIKFKHPDRQPMIQISAQETLTHWQFAIMDNGIGIAEEYIQKVFQLFKRLHTNTEYEGSGIGLATCKKIIQQHQGEIWVQSTLDQGSTFYFTIKK